MDFQKYIFSDPYFGWLCQGILFTLIITLLTTIISVLFGFLIASCRMNSNRWLQTFGTVYINLFRNIPPVPLLLFLVFGLPSIFPQIFKEFFSFGIEFPLLVLGLSFNTSAYIAEILRSGINAVPKVHLEAARVLGLKPAAIRMKVIYPQALRITFPALGTRLIHNMKNSTMALVLPLPLNAMEVLGQAGRIAGQTFAWAEPLVFAAFVHLTLAFILSFIMSRVSRNAQRKVEILQ
jgi:polar amino acid transport system permease protein